MPKLRAQHLDDMLGKGWCKSRSGIYAIVDSPPEEIIYIGSTSNLPHRLRGHLWTMENRPEEAHKYKTGDGSTPIFRVLEFVADRLERLEREQYYINIYNPRGNRKNAYPSLNNSWAKVPRFVKELDGEPLPIEDAMVIGDVDTKWIYRRCNVAVIDGRYCVGKTQFDAVLLDYITPKIVSVPKIVHIDGKEVHAPVKTEAVHA